MSEPEFIFSDTVRPRCEVGMGSPQDGTYPTWFDVSMYVHEAEMQRGRERFTERFDPGTCTVTFDNRSGWADLTGDPAGLSLRPGRQVRIGVEGPWGTDGAVATRWLFRGFIDRCKPSYDPVLHDIVTVDCVDSLGEVGNVKLATVPEGALPLGPNQTVDERINTLLSSASWSGTRTLAPSAERLIGTKMGAQMIDELGQSADSSGGVVYGDLDGGITYKDRDWMLWTAGEQPDAAIGNVQKVAVPAQEAYLTPRFSSSGARTPGTSDMRLNKDQHWIFKIRPTGAATSSQHGVLASQGYSATAPNKAFRLNVQATDPNNGRIDFHYSPDGSSLPMLSVAAGNYWRSLINLRKPFWLYVGLDVSTTAPPAPGYFSPTVGTLTTPDPGPLPNACVWVFKVMHPSGAAPPPHATLASQWETNGNRSWLLQQRLDTGNIVTRFSYSGQENDATTNTVSGATPTNTIEYIAVVRDFNGGVATFGARHTLKVLTSTDGVGWTQRSSSAELSNGGVFDATGIVRIGAGGVNSEIFNGRIYSAELRTGLDPNLGSVVWRYDTAEYPGTGTSFVDPRGRTWTLSTAAAITAPVPSATPVFSVSTKYSLDGATWLPLAPPVYGPAVLAPPASTADLYVGGELGEAFYPDLLYAECREGLIPGPVPPDWEGTLPLPDPSQGRLIWRLFPNYWEQPQITQHDYLNNDLNDDGVDDNWSAYKVPGSFTPPASWVRDVVNGQYQLLKINGNGPGGSTYSYYGVETQGVFGVGAPTNVIYASVKLTHFWPNVTTGESPLVHIQLVWYDQNMVEITTGGGGPFITTNGIAPTKPTVFSLSGVPPANGVWGRLRVSLWLQGAGAPAANAPAELKIYETVVKRGLSTLTDSKTVAVESDTLLRTWTSVVVTPRGLPSTPADVCPSGWEVDFDRAQLTTQVEIGRVMPEFFPNTYTLVGGYPVAGGGQIALNGAQGAATMLSIAYTTSSGLDISSLLRFIRAGATIRISDANDTGNKSRTYLVTGQWIDYTTWFQIPVLWTDGEVDVPAGAVTLMLNVPAEAPTFFPDQAAIDLYGYETFSRTDLLNVDTAVFQTLANRWIAIRGITSMPRIESVTLNAATGRGSLDVVDLMSSCAPEVPTRYHCRLQTDTGRMVFDRLMFATSVRHFVSRDEWTLRIGLDAAEWAETLGAT